MLGGSAWAQQSFGFGVVPQFEARKLASIWVPVLRELEKRTGYKFKMIGSENIPDFEVDFLGGKLDFAYMNPYHAMLAGRKQGYIPLVRDVGRKLFGILVVRKDSSIKSVSGLEGKSISFPAPNALGASLLIRADLKNIFSVSVKPIYVNTHSSVFLNVVLGKTPAGGGVMSTLKRQKEAIRSKLRIIQETRRIPPHPIVAHPRIAKAIREKVRQALLELGRSPEGAKLLSLVPIRKIGVATMADYLLLAEWGLEEFYVD